MRWQLQDNTAHIPMKHVGPIQLHTPDFSTLVSVPLATFETPLWPSVQRGARVTQHAGGIRTVVVRENMTRSIMLEADDVFALIYCQERILAALPEWQHLAQQTSRFVQLQHIHAQPIGNQLFLRLSFQTGDAAGHNMATLAADHILNQLLTQFPQLRYVSISGNFCTDKKTSSVNALLGRGKYVIAETLISPSLCKRFLKVTPEQLTRIHVRKNLLGSIAAGSLHSANAHAANMLLAFFLATGQDAANIVEGSQAIVHAEVQNDHLYFSVTLPNLIVGTVGNGKHLAFAEHNLKELGCKETDAAIGDNARKLAMIAAATVLCGELSLLAAQTLPSELIRSHVTLERKRDMSSNKKEGIRMTLPVGIDAIAIYTPRYVLNLSDLAHARGIDPDKFHQGLGQYAMAVTPPGEDIITMAANAAHQLLSTYSDAEKSSIRTILFATESGVDQSKAAGLYLLDLLDLPKSCRIVELKQACYAGTAGLQLILPYLHLHPDEKILWLASDIARYGLNTNGESSQGAGAVAMMLSVNPKILAIEPESGIAAENTMDFWRPNYLNEAIVEGKHSSKLYLSMLDQCFHEYQAKSGRSFQDHDFFCYHVPVPKLVEKAHQFMLRRAGISEHEQHIQPVLPSLEYGRQIGNSYTAALYIALASLLDYPELQLAGKRVGFYSYGSGCVAEYFSGIIQPDFANAIHTDYHQQLLAERMSLNYEEYKAMYLFKYPEDGLRFDVPHFATGKFRLTRIEEHKRIYDRIA